MTVDKLVITKDTMFDVYGATYTSHYSGKETDLYVLVPSDYAKKHNIEFASEVGFGEIEGKHSDVCEDMTKTTMSLNEAYSFFKKLYDNKMDRHAASFMIELSEADDVDLVDWNGLYDLNDDVLKALKPFLDNQLVTKTVEIPEMFLDDFNKFVESIGGNELDQVRYQNELNS